jgi:thiol-disulfide isomerase/thioredoxin
MAPGFSLPAIANAAGTIDLDALRGDVVYLDFWASWCGPCRLSLPALDGLYQELQDQGLHVVAVSVDVVAEDSLDFLARYPVTYPVAIDTTGDTARSFAVNGMPSGYLIDRSGTVQSVHVGFKRGDEKSLRHEILELLAP